MTVNQRADLDTFRTTGTATYRVEAVEPDLARFVGCETATHRIVGRLFTMYGYFMATGRPAGREVKVPGWTRARLGIRAVFVPAVIEHGTNGSVPIEGWVA
jgi:hypothetical protein